jgi:hypothetical protein
MSLATNIAKRSDSSVYQARLGIPPDLQQFYPVPGKPGKFRVELRQSLGTRDRREAREKVLPVLMKWRAEFAELRKRREPTPADLLTAVWSRYEGELDKDGQTRAALPTSATIEAARGQLQVDIKAGRVPWSNDPLAQLDAALDLIVMRDAAKLDRERRQVYLRDLKKHLAIGETALISVYADDVILREGLLIERGTPAYGDLCQRLQRAQIEALERTMERDNGNWRGNASILATAGTIGTAVGAFRTFLGILGPLAVGITAVKGVFDLMGYATDLAKQKIEDFYNMAERAGKAGVRVNEALSDCASCRSRKRAGFVQAILQLVEVEADRDIKLRWHWHLLRTTRPTPLRRP